MNILLKVREVSKAVFPGLVGLHPECPVLAEAVEELRQRLPWRNERIKIAVSTNHSYR